MTANSSNVIQCQVMKDTCDQEFSNLSGVFDTTIRFTTQIGRSGAKRMSIYEYDRAQKVAQDYSELTREVITFVHSKDVANKLFSEKRTLKKRK